jgi:acetylornithine deacetylase/succinyl-diaminopimelate desuccinylase-like protein
MVGREDSGEADPAPDPISALRATLTASQGEVVRIARALIQCPSENPPGDEHQAALCAQDLLSDVEEAHVRVVEPAPKRLSVIASAGPLGRRTLLIGVHLDTVPAGDGWTRPPFGGELENGRIYGRGATDNKGAAAAAIVAFRALVRHGITDHSRVVLVLNADEEVGGRLGMDHVRDVLGEPISAALIAEPSGIRRPFERLWVGARGWLRFEVTTEAESTHTSLMAEPGVRSALVDLNAVLSCLAERLTSSNDMTESGYPRLELILSRMEGGEGWGVVPASAKAQLELRVTPGLDRDTVVHLVSEAFGQARQATGAAAALTLPAGREWTAPSEIDPAHPVVRAATRAWRETLGEEPRLGCIPSGTDARSLSEVGIASLPGVGPGTLRRCHTKDEYVTIDELMIATQLYGLSAWHYLSR